MSLSIETNSERQRQQQQKQQQEQEQAIVRSRLVQKLLLPTPDIREFLQNLVYTQAVVIAGTEAAAFLLVPDEQQQQLRLENVAHIRPDSSTADVKQQALKAFSEIVGSCIQANNDGAVEVGNTDGNWESQYCLVTLLRAEGRIVAATAVITRCKDDARAQQRLDVMQVVAGYFDFHMLRVKTEGLRVMAQGHQDVLQYASALATADGFANGVHSVCNELATRTGATRVSVGWVYGDPHGRGSRVKLKGLSHTEQFDKKQELSVQIVKVMEEAADQEEIVQFDPDKQGATTQNVTREAASLSRMEGGNRVVSLPLRRKGDICGVLTLEFPSDKAPTDQETTGLAVAAELLGPVLYDRHANDRWLITKAGLSTRETWKAVIGPKHWLAKTCVAAGLIGAWLLCGGYVPYWEAPYYKGLVLPMHTVKAPFEFVSDEKRVVTAGVDGIIKKAHKRAGDVVKKDDLLLEFKDEEVQTKLIAATARRDRALAEARALDAQRDQRGQPQTAAANVKRQEAREADAEIALANVQLGRLKVVAPIDGVITMGDLRDRELDSVRQGEQLFEVADLAKLKVQIALDDRDGQIVREGSFGTIRTSARPDLSHRYTVKRVVPAAQAKEGRNTFTVYADVDPTSVPAEVSASWRPGMEGESATDNAPKPLVWQWTHRLVDWAYLTFGWYF